MRDYRRNNRINKQQKSIAVKNIPRRIFCLLIAQTSAAAAMLSSCSSIKKTNLESEDDWKTMDALYLHLFPKDSLGPSSVDINATNYLKNIVSSKKTSRYKKNTIRNGMMLINKTSHNLYSKKFIELNTQESY